jgi:capsular exopolysaccharide synthesis family protein
LNFLLRGKSTEGGKVVLVTSSIKGEGKTLVAAELASAYSGLQKKVLLIGADLRNPRIHEHFGGNRNTVGLSDYLSNPDQEWETCIIQPDSKNAYLNLVYSGRIPPNAPQLLAGDRFADFLIKARRHFDLVLVDSAPTVLVTDTMLISELADATLYVTRAEYSEKRLLEHAESLFKQKKLTNMGMIVNDVNPRKGRSYGYGYGYGYNYGYGYGYSADKRPKAWYKRLLGI